MIFGDFDSYIENLCVKHKKILHSAKEPHYFRHGLDQILTGLTKDVNYPYVSREKSDYVYEDNGADSYTKNRSVALNFMHHTRDTTDDDEQQRLLDILETIIDDFISLMMVDKKDRKHAFLKYFDLNSVDCTNISSAMNPDRAFGYFVTFKITNWQDITVIEDNWVQPEPLIP